MDTFADVSAEGLAINTTQLEGYTFHINRVGLLPAGYGDSIKSERIRKLSFSNFGGDKVSLEGLIKLTGYSNYRYVMWVQSDSRTLLIPQELYEETKLPHYLSVGGISLVCKEFAVTPPVSGKIAVSAMDQQLNSILQRYFNGNIINITPVQIMDASPLPAIKKRAQIRIFIGSGVLSLVVKDKSNRLAWAETYSVKTKEDIVYIIKFLEDKLSLKDPVPVIFFSDDPDLSDYVSKFFHRTLCV